LDQSSSSFAATQQHPYKQKKDSGDCSATLTNSIPLLSLVVALKSNHYFLCLRADLISIYFLHRRVSFSVSCTVASAFVSDTLLGGV
jgi:hypothetical protein